MVKQSKNTKATTNAADNLANIEFVIGKIMRIGVTLSIVAMLVGLGLIFVHPAQHQSDFPTRLAAIGQGVVQSQPMAWLMLGLLLLIFTPVLRVIVSIFAFAKIHDHLYVAITSLVLIILGVAIFYGYHGH